jgi:Terminase RNaseH-like domain
MKGLVSFAEKSLGLTLWPGQVEVLNDWEASRKRKAVLVLGRRSGKGLMASVAAIKNAIDDYQMPRPGEQRNVVCVATRSEQSQEFVRVTRELLEAAPDSRLKALVNWEAHTQDEILFRNNVRVVAMPCSSRSTRGLATSLLVLDEAGWMSTAEDGFQAGKQVFNALAPGTAQFGNKGYIMLASTPNWRSGVLWDLYEQGQSGGDVFVAQRPTWEMNPNVSREQLEPEFRADPDSANREYGALFSAGAGAYMQADEILSCKRQEGTLAPVQTTAYVGAVDPGYQGDSFGLVVLHREAGLVVVDGAWSWNRQGHEHTLDEVAAIAKAYRITALRTDQHATVPVSEGLSRRGIGVRYVPWTSANKIQAYSQLKTLVNTGQIELPNHERLLSELFTLEARPSATGMTRIAAAGSAHDDLASALAAALAMLGNSISPESVSRMRELLADLGAPSTGGGGGRFGSVVGVPGMPLGPDRIDR